MADSCGASTWWRIDSYLGQPRACQNRPMQTAKRVLIAAGIAAARHGHA